MENIDFNNKWVLYSHEINDTDYTLESYTKHFETNNYKDFVDKMNNICNDKMNMELNNIWSNKIFFFMRENITPRYEDEKNVNGSYWGYRINKNYSYTTLFSLCIQLMGECLFEDMNVMSNVNGISISPKNNTTTIRIWFSHYYEMSNIIKLQNITPNIDPNKYKLGINKY
jgi:hypothetical protein